VTPIFIITGDLPSTEHGETVRKIFNNALVGGYRRFYFLTKFEALYPTNANFSKDDVINLLAENLSCSINAVEQGMRVMLSHERRQHVFFRKAGYMKKWLILNRKRLIVFSGGIVASGEGEYSLAHDYL
jgi:hypothetical protein